MNPTPCPRCGGEAWTTSGRMEPDGFICRPCAEEEDSAHPFMPPPEEEEDEG